MEEAGSSTDTLANSWLSVDRQLSVHSVLTIGILVDSVLTRGMRKELSWNWLAFVSLASWISRILQQ